MNICKTETTHVGVASLESVKQIIDCITTKRFLITLIVWSLITIIELKILENCIESRYN